VEANPFAGMEPEAMLRTLREEAERLEARANQLRNDLSDATATATSPDGAVTVTLSPTGALQNISFSAKVSDHRPEALGALVMRTAREAGRQVSAKLAESLDPATAEFVRQFALEPEEEHLGRSEQHPDVEYGGILRKRKGRS
jgi:DNA-binding protein YbaB